MQAAEQFRTAIEGAGLTPPDAIIPDGKFHRFPTNGHRDDDSGWYKLHFDGLPAGAFGDWRTGFTQKWCAKSDTAMTAKERAEYRQRIDKIQRERDVEEQRRHEEVAERARTIWDHAGPAPADHPYLRSKAVQAHGLRVGADGRLIVPIYQAGVLSSLEFIDDNGTKRYLYGGAKQGGALVLGDLTNAATLLLCEGYATGASLYQGTNLPTVIAFDAGNLQPVAEQLRQLYPTATILLCGDNDIHADGKPNTGLEKATAAAKAINGVLLIPELDGKKCDWNDVHQARGLEAVRKAVEGVLPRPQEPGKENTNQPELDCDIGDLDEITRLAWDAIVTGNRPAQLFRYGSRPSRIELDEDGHSLRIVELTADRLRHHAAHLARWTRTKSQRRVECRPPIDVINNMLAAPDIPLPLLSQIVEVPVFSHRGSLVQHPGYDASAQLYYRPYDTATTASIPTDPTAAEVASAKARLDDVLADFPFVSEADTAHAVALALVPFVRLLIDGPVPLHATESPSPGSGKNLLVDVLLYPSVGRSIGAIAEARDDDEWRKRLTARLLEGCPITLIDNLSRPLDSGTVASVLTARRWEDRRLGKTETIVVPVHTIFVCTANNPLFSMEIARRSIRIRLDPKMDRPWLRDGFRHADLRAFVEQERPALISALLTFAQAWLKAGRPKPAANPLGSFEAWSHVVGGIVEFAGYQKFLGNALEFYEAADSEGMLWRLFVSSWWDTYQGRTVSVKELFDIATAIDGFYLGRGSSERGQKTVLGQSLKKHRDQIVGCFRIQEAGTYGSGVQWQLQQIANPVPKSDECVESLTLTD